jgi:hypothetical protein
MTSIVTVRVSKNGYLSTSTTVNGTASPLLPGGTITLTLPTRPVANTPINLSVTSDVNSNGAVTYSVTGTNCYLTGSTLLATTATTCSVTATRAADGTHSSTSTISPATIVIAATPPLTPQSPGLTVSGNTNSIVVGNTISLSATGGSVGTFTYFTTTTNCTISSGNILSATVPTTCSVFATRSGDTTYAPITSSISQFIFQSQALIAQTSTPVVSGTPAPPNAVGSTITLVASQGSGSGGYTLTTSSPASICTLVGNTLTAVGPGGCQVTVTKLGDQTYSSASATTTFNITNVGNPNAFQFTNGVYGGIIAGTPVTLSAQGGPGTGKVSYSTNSFGCTIRGAILTVSQVQTPCDVSATKAASGTVQAVTISQTFTFVARSQSALRISTKIVSAGFKSSLGVTLTAAGGSGSGAISYYSASPGCIIAGNTLKGTNGANCSVTATRDASSIYSAITSLAVVFHFSS